MQGIKPAPCLVNTFGNKIGREILLDFEEYFFILQNG